MPTYQGHRSWNAWNVSLWINNDEDLYRRAVSLVKLKGARWAAKQLAGELAGQRTPDGGCYNLTTIREAIRGILD